MMFFSGVFELNAVEQIGWVLLHSTWQLLLIGLAYATAKQFFNSPNLRYGIGVCCLVVAIVAPLVTYFALSSFVPGSITAESIASRNDLASANSDVRITSSLDSPVDQPPSPAPNSVVTSTPMTANTFASNPTTSTLLTNPQPQGVTAISNVSFIGWFRVAAPWLVMAWLGGMALLSIRPIFGWHFASKARNQGTKPASQKILNSAQQIAKQLGLQVSINVFESTIAKVPMVVGYLKPVILLPVSAITHLTADELESILRHEIAHIRRHDTVINFFQTVIETVLFYHPCVWWISDQVRIERENCCDDLAAGNQREALSLAQALLRLEEVRLSDHAIVAANGGDLKSRVRRLLHDSKRSQRGSRRKGVAAAFATASLVIIMTSLIGFSTLNSNTPTEEDEFTQVVITSFNNASDSNEFEVDQRKDVARLLKFFPEAGSNRRGSRPAGYENDFQLAFARENGDRVVVGVSLSRQLWSEGNGDWILQNHDELEALIQALADKYLDPQKEDSISTVSTAIDSSDSSLEAELDEKIKRLGGVYSVAEFNSQDFMEFAEAVLGLDPEKREELLKKWAPTYDGQVILLCRMLFQAKPDSDFRRPLLGQPMFIGGTRINDWPLEPIALVDNVPFLVTKGYILGGLPESAEKYLEYCLKECDWSTQNYGGCTPKKLAFALSKIADRITLDEAEIASLQRQIKTRPVDELEEAAYRLGSWSNYNNARAKNAFISGDYMRVANQLQRKSEKDRTKYLKRWSQINELNDPVIVLCRMLFEAKANNKFRRPYLGDPVFLTGNASHWPLEPIALVNNIPVTVVRGHNLAGLPEPSLDYLEYCLANCNWSDNDYSGFDSEAAQVAFNELNRIGFKDKDALRKWKQQLQLPFDNMKVYEAEKVRLEREHKGEWMVIADEVVHGPFESITIADQQVPGNHRLIFRPGIDDKDVEFPLSPFIATSPRKFIQFGRQFAIDHRLTMSANAWQTKRNSIDLHDGRAEFALSSPDGKKTVTRKAVCSSLFVDQLVITEQEVRELGLERFRVPGVATYDPKHPGYKVFVKVEIAGLEIEDYLLAYVIPDIVTEPATLNLQREDLIRELKAEGKNRDQPDSDTESPPIFQTWKMVGRVTDTDGKPIPNAEIRMATGFATLMGGGSTTSDSEGGYELEFGEGVAMQGSSTQVAWCFVSHPEYVYYSNSRGVDLSMAMSRDVLTAEQIQQSAFTYVEPQDLIVRGRLHEFDIVMCRPAELLATVVNRDGNRIADSGLQLDGSNQTSEVCNIDVTQEEKERHDLYYGVRPEREWRFSIPGMDRRHRVQSSPLVFADAQKHVITFVRTGEGAEMALEIQSVVDVNGNDVTDQIVNLDPLTSAPLPANGQTEGRKLIRKMAEKNGRWMFPSIYGSSNDGPLKAQITRNGENEWLETSHPSSLQPTHYSSLHIVADNPDQAIIRAIKKQGKTIEVAYTLRKPGRQSFGNGIGGKFNGYVSSNVYTGIVTIDADTMTPLKHQSGKFVTTFRDFRQLKDGSFVPGEVQTRGKLNCDWKFQLLEGEVYVVSELSTSVGERNLVTTVDQVELDGKELSPIND